MEFHSRKTIAFVVLILVASFLALNISMPVAQAGDQPMPITGVPSTEGSPTSVMWTPSDYGYPVVTPYDYGYPVGTPEPTIKPSPIPTILPWGITPLATETTGEREDTTVENGNEVINDRPAEGEFGLTPRGQWRTTSEQRKGELPAAIQELIDRVIQMVLSGLGFATEK